MKSFKKGSKHPPEAHENNNNNNNNSSNKEGDSSESVPLTGEPPPDDFSARRSSRVAAGRYAADGDTWVEALAVCELPATHARGKKGRNGKKGRGIGIGFGRSKSAKSASSSGNGGSGSGGSGDGDPGGGGSMTDAEIADASDRLTIRPYFQSSNTRQKVWDEPPSGASNIVYATPEARRMAQAQLEEMRNSYAQRTVHHHKNARDEIHKELGVSGKAPGGIGRGLTNSKSTSAILSKGKKMLGISGGDRGPGKRGSDGGSSGGGSDSGRTDTDSEYASYASERSRAARGGGHLYKDEFLNHGIPPSVMEESITAANVNVDPESRTKASLERAGATSNYERDMQKAMLMSMGIGGGSVMGGNGAAKASGKKGRGSSSSSTDPKSNGMGQRDSGLTRQEQEQLAMATALSLSEVHTSNRKKSASAENRTASDKERSKQQRKSSRSNDNRGSRGGSESSGGDSRKGAERVNSRSTRADFDDDGGGKMPAAASATSGRDSHRRQNHRREERSAAQSRTGESVRANTASAPPPSASVPFDDPYVLLPPTRDGIKVDSGAATAYEDDWNGGFGGGGGGEFS